MEFANYGSFRKAILSNLNEYNLYGRGYYPRTKQYYDHIASLPNNATTEEKLALIQRIIADDGVAPDLFIKPHKDAHHLNSSQVVCYEFFRPMITVQKRANSLLLSFLNSIGLPSEEFSAGYGEFEWEPNNEEQTNFDFYVQQSRPIPETVLTDKAIYFEIKYTESEFGAEPINDRRREKYDSIYTQMIDNCVCLKRRPSIEEYFKSYQLFRNTIRLTKDNWQNEYVVFLFPRENKAVLDEYRIFEEHFILEQYRNHIKAVYWEDLVESMSDRFREKFFPYL